MDQSYMKKQPVLGLVVKMSLPMVISMLVNSLYNIVDSLFVAKISENAMTALSLVFPLQNLIGAIMIGFGVGINAVISFYLGAQDHKMADRSASQGLFLATLHGILLSIVCIAIMPSFLQKFTNDPDIISIGIRYSGIAFCFAVMQAWGLVFEKTGISQNGFTLNQYHNADAKFIGDHIITSVDEGIRILDLEGKTVASYDGLAASWMYVMEDDVESRGPEDHWFVAYSNHADETHILELTADFQLVEDRIAVTTDTLAIDPILVKMEDGWLLTNTEIDGTINNPSPDGDNGIYSVQLYSSEDLKTWEPQTTIISKKQNLEDGDIRYLDGTLYYFFEMEDYDKGPSKICVMTSDDQGGSWSEPTVLLPNVADNEMASCEQTDYGWRLYVSSDYACVGESYQGASVYYNDYKEDFTPISTYQRSEMPDNGSVRLYEAKEIDGQMNFLFARNFLTDCDLLLRTMEKGDEMQ